jgi:hypothetical protein
MCNSFINRVSHSLIFYQLSVAALILLSDL